MSTKQRIACAFTRWVFGRYPSSVMARELRAVLRRDGIDWQAKCHHERTND